MKRRIVIATLILAGVGMHLASAQAERKQTIFDAVVFYDGYKQEVVDADLNDGITRHANHLYARPLTQEELDWFGSDLRMEVLVDALCDNYDRIGNVNIAFVEKGAKEYDPETTPRIEVARFITPFMNKNFKPSQVPYVWDADRLALIFRDAQLREKYDMWMELELFGVPYAANTQVAGCANRNDVFAGTINFYTDSEPMPVVLGHHLYPVVIKRPESKGHNLNNYSEQGTDEIGTCVKTWTFNVDTDLADAEITLVMSNHGANAGGEEYNRRSHMVYFDGKLINIFTPGGKSCEEYRQYNTQGNGIYGPTPKTESQWTSWNNWCPGDKIPTRTFPIGALAKGEHSIKIKVPKAQFVNNQGDFPVSLYVQGVEEGQLVDASVEEMAASDIKLNVVAKGNRLLIDTEADCYRLEVYDLDGTLFWQSWRSDKEVQMEGWPSGAYVAVVLTSDGTIAYAKFLR